jgi:hypothetical protein
MHTSFAIGHRDQTYPGFRPLMGAEWRSTAVLSALIAYHGAHDGLPLLGDQPIHASTALHCGEGWLLLGGHRLVFQGHDVTHPDQTIAVGQRYRIQDRDSGACWLAAPPDVATWGTAKVLSHTDMYHTPCIFVPVRCTMWTVFRLLLVCQSQCVRNWSRLRVNV